MVIDKGIFLRRVKDMFPRQRNKATMELNHIRNKLSMQKIYGLSKKPVVRNIITVASGTAIAQMIGILFSPIVTRIYGPEAFGVLGVFTSLTGIIIPVVALTYPTAIVLPKRDEEAKSLVRLSLYIAIIITAVITLSLFLYGTEMLTTLNMEVLIPFIPFVPFILIFSAGQQVAEQWIIRKKQYKVIARVLVANVLLLNVAKIGLGLYIAKAIVLITLTTLGQASIFAMLALGSKLSLTKKHSNGKSEQIEKVSLSTVARMYKDFPIYRSPQMLINGLTQSLPILMLTAFFGPIPAGFYAIGNRVLSLPSQIIGKAVGDVFYPRIAEASHNKESLSKLVIKSTLLLATVGLIPFATVVVVGPWLFGFVFGSEWVVAGEYARWMALWTYFIFINNPSVRTLPVIAEQRFHLIFTNINLAVRLSMLIIGAYIFDSATVAIALFSIAGVSSNIVLILLIIKKCRNYDARYTLR